MGEATGAGGKLRRGVPAQDARDSGEALGPARGGLVSVRFVFFLVGVLALLVVAVMLW